MASLMARISSFITGRSANEPPLLHDVDEPERTSFGFRPFSARREVRARHDNVTALTDLLISMRETIERQGQRHEELMTYLSHLPKAMEMVPDLSKQQAEALSVIKQHLENQGTQGKQMSTILEKVGQAAVDQRRILDSVRQRLDTLAEHDQQVATHFNNFAGALSTSADTTKFAGELLKTLDTHVRERDEAFERIIRTQNRRHTIMLIGSIILSAAALIAVTVGEYLRSGSH